MKIFFLNIYIYIYIYIYKIETIVIPKFSKKTHSPKHYTEKDTNEEQKLRPIKIAMNFNNYGIKSYGTANNAFKLTNHFLAR